MFNEQRKCYVFVYAPALCRSNSGGKLKERMISTKVWERYATVLSDFGIEVIWKTRKPERKWRNVCIPVYCLARFHAVAAVNNIVYCQHICNPPQQQTIHAHSFIYSTYINTYSNVFASKQRKSEIIYWIFFFCIAEVCMCKCVFLFCLPSLFQKYRAPCFLSSCAALHLSIWF